MKDLADTGNLFHGYLFFGSEGVGKKTIARHLANYLEEKKWEEPSALIDFTLIEAEKETIGIDAAREIKRYLSQTPLKSPRRTVVIDQAETLTPEAQNALLKVTEESPAQTLIIYLAHDPDALLPTLLSRLEKIYFAPAPIAEVEQWLAAEFKLPEAEAKELVRRTFGSPGLAARIARDKKFDALIKLAEQFAAAGESGVGVLLKKIGDKDDFRLGAFLDALILLRAEDAKTHPAQWHELLTLRGNAEYYNLNTKIQLRALRKILNGSRS